MLTPDAPVGAPSVFSLHDALDGPAATGTRLAAATVDRQTSGDGGASVTSQVGSQQTMCRVDEIASEVEVDVTHRSLRGQPTGVHDLALVDVADTATDALIEQYNANGGSRVGQRESLDGHCEVRIGSGEVGAQVVRTRAPSDQFDDGSIEADCDPSLRGLDHGTNRTARSEPTLA